MSPEKRRPADRWEEGQERGTPLKTFQFTKEVIDEILAREEGAGFLAEMWVYAAYEDFRSDYGGKSGFRGAYQELFLEKYGAGGQPYGSPIRKRDALGLMHGRKIEQFLAEFPFEQVLEELSLEQLARDLVDKKIRLPVYTAETLEAVLEGGDLPVIPLPAEIRAKIPNQGSWEENGPEIPF